VAYHFLHEKFNTMRVCPLTYPGTYSWAITLGFEMEWVDCDEEGWPVSDVDVGVDLWGRAFPRWCVVLDAAHRVLDGRHAAGLCNDDYHAVAYSFGPQKEHSAPNGGALVCRAFAAPAVRAAAEAWVGCGQSAPLGGGIRATLDDPTCDAVLAQMRAHKRKAVRRQKILQEYEKWFEASLMTRPVEASGHLCVVKLPTEGHVLAARARLARLRIEHSLHYPIPAEVQEQCPNATRLTRQLITLPCHLKMSLHDVRVISRNVLTA
jgi:dTDP-4-amino-4,6-dideoxygalactose transaminase